jgi:hypothetical protein
MWLIFLSVIQICMGYNHMLSGWVMNKEINVFYFAKCIDYMYWFDDNDLILLLIFIVCIKWYSIHFSLLSNYIDYPYS